MKLDYTLGLYLFAAFYLFGIILNYIHHPLEAWIKGISTLFLVLPMLLHRGGITRSLQATMIAALVFCAAGDFALVIRDYEPFTAYNDVLFQIGLASYLIGYLAIGVVLLISGVLDKLTYWVGAITAAISMIQYFLFRKCRSSSRYSCATLPLSGHFIGNVRFRIPPTYPWKEKVLFDHRSHHHLHF
jgi:hypothetical protein